MGKLDTETQERMEGLVLGNMLQKVVKDLQIEGFDSRDIRLFLNKKIYKLTK